METVANTRDSGGKRPRRKSSESPSRTGTSDAEDSAAERGRKGKKRRVTFPEEPEALAVIVGEAAGPPEGLLPPGCSARDSVALCMVADEAELDEFVEGGGNAFGPEFTHQVFEHEVIPVVPGMEVVVRLAYGAASLACFVKLELGFIDLDDEEDEDNDDEEEGEGGDGDGEEEGEEANGNEWEGGKEGGAAKSKADCDSFLAVGGKAEAGHGNGSDGSSDGENSSGGGVAGGGDGDSSGHGSGSGENKVLIATTVPEQNGYSAKGGNDDGCKHGSAAVEGDITAAPVAQVPQVPVPARNPGKRLRRIAPMSVPAEARRANSVVCREDAAPMPREPAADEARTVAHRNGTIEQEERGANGGAAADGAASEPGESCGGDAAAMDVAAPCAKEGVGDEKGDGASSIAAAAVNRASAVSSAAGSSGGSDRRKYGEAAELEMAAEDESGDDDTDDDDDGDEGNDGGDEDGAEGEEGDEEEEEEGDSIDLRVLGLEGLEGIGSRMPSCLLHRIVACERLIVNSLLTCVPDDSALHRDTFLEQLAEREAAFMPPGHRELVYEAAGREKFCVYRATGKDKGAVEYHNRAQGLAYWFIETADKIDLSDERWEVFYLYHVEKVESGPAVGDKAPAKEACGDDNGGSRSSGDDGEAAASEEGASPTAGGAAAVTDDAAAAGEIPDAATLAGPLVAAPAATDAAEAPAIDAMDVDRLPDSSAAAAVGATAAATAALGAASTRLRFVGYFTVHNFRNPLLGVRQRVCQALLLPPYQRRGHGGRLLRHIYARAAKRPEVFEVTVEDPAPAFVALRDVTEAQLCRDANVFSSEALGGRSLTAEELEGIRFRLKITAAQVEVAHELLRYVALDTSNEEACKRFRLTVKRRLLKRHREELPPADAARKARLDELYREEEERYRGLAPRLAGKAEAAAAADATVCGDSSDPAVGAAACGGSTATAVDGRVAVCQG